MVYMIKRKLLESIVISSIQWNYSSKIKIRCQRHMIMRNNSRTIAKHQLLMLGKVRVHILQSQELAKLTIMPTLLLNKNMSKQLLISYKI